MSASATNISNQIKWAVRHYELESGQTVKSIRLVRLDKPGFVSGSSSNLVDVEVVIKGV